MTVRQFHDLEPGERVHWCGKDPENGTVIANGRSLIVQWDSGQRTTHSPMMSDLFRYAPTAMDEARR